jgi:DNA-binding NarL/FixJ family response regulator
MAVLIKEATRTPRWFCLNAAVRSSPVMIEGQRVLLADDDVAIRTALRRVLESDGFSVCGEAEDAGTAVALARGERPDVVLIEVRLPGNGLRAVAEIGTQQPGVAVVVLSVSSDHSDVFAAFRGGASGYLLKDTDLDRIPLVLRAVLGGETALPRSLVGGVVNELRRRAEGRVRLANDRAVRLTDREWEVLELLRGGLTTRQISAQLFISDVTVRTHIAATLKKLGVHDRSDAIIILEEIEAHEEPAV